MKLVFTLTCVVFSVYLFGISEAAPKIHRKRALAQEMCPNSATSEECLAYATEQSKKKDHCHRFFASHTWIEWQSCGSVQCGENMRIVPEDLSKPYPECCSTCEIIDSTKPAQMSGIM